MTISALQQMKRDGKKSIGVVAWDYQIARIADRAGVDFVSVGDSVGVNLWGRSDVARSDDGRNADLLQGGARAASSARWSAATCRTVRCSRASTRRSPPPSV